MKAEDMLKKLMKSLSDVPKVRLGILGAKAAVTRDKQGGGDSPMTNAEIGAAHEFGTATLPKRSWLREPVTDKMQERLESAGFFNEENVNEILKTQDLEKTMRKVGIVGEAIVADAFATGGFGAWKPSNMSRKKVHQTLVETQQLRNSITSDLEKNK